MNEPKPAAARFALWRRDHRTRDRRRRPWQSVATAETGLELTGRMRELPDGEFLTLPIGEHPDDRRAGTLGASS